MTSATSPYPAILQALAEVPAPAAWVDLAALEANAAELLRQAAPLPIRVASKSVRCTAVLQHLFGLSDDFRGAMAFTVPEALHLAAQGIDDILLGYPASEAAEQERLAAWQAAHPEQAVRLMVDDVRHLELAGAAGRAAGVELRVCLDTDTAWHPMGRARAAIGARRSPLRTPEQAAALARASRAIDGVRIDAIMAYDAQVAGVGDNPPGRPLRARAIQLMQRRSLADLTDRVPRIVEAVQRELAADGGLALVNVGGTGSLERVARLSGATELTAGSGFYAPTLFDTYRHLHLQPAAGFTLSVVRRPSEGVATLLGGGYVASGAAGPDRLPQPVWPEGLQIDPNEAAGEVQTPLLGRGAGALQIGDRVVLRHAKAGELCERFASLHLIRDGEVERVVPTYRGEGLTFL